jgi:hypothetical protein
MLQSGHAPGHVRETFLDAVQAFMDWNDGEPEPMVGFEVDYVEHQIPISKACALVWNCTDIIPGSEYRSLADLRGLCQGDARGDQATALKAICSGCRPSPSARPSTVVISRPWYCTASARQPLMR